MNLLCNKKSSLRQKPHILTIEQSYALGQIVGARLTKNMRNQGLLPTHLFRLKKRKLEAIFQYLTSHHLIHKELLSENVQTHQLAEYLLSIIYPGYSVARARNFAYADYRECREKEPESLDPLAYDYVPTTEMFERLDEVYYVDVDWQDKQDISEHCIDVPVSLLKKSIDRVDVSNSHKPLENIVYHLYLWNSTRTLIKPECKSLIFDSNQVWGNEKQKAVKEGFMHIDISEQIKASIRRKSMGNTQEYASLGQSIHIQIELQDNNEQNISHISICAIIKKSSQELVSQLFMQSTTEFIHKSVYSSPYPLITQQMMIQVLKQRQEDPSKDAENIFMTCMAGAIHNNEKDADTDVMERISLKDPTTSNRIQYPVRTIHCKHRSCFDASVFFDRHMGLKLWHCPICLVQIKYLEELKMDYTIKLALDEYEQEDHIYIMQDRLVVSEAEFILIDEELIEDDFQDQHISKKLRALTHVT